MMMDPDGTAYMADLLNLRQVVEQRTKDFKSMPNNFKDFDAAEKRDQKLQAAAEDAEVHGRCPKRKTRTYFFFGKRVEVCNHVFCSGGSLLCGFGVCCKCDPKEHVSPSNAPFFFFSRVECPCSLISFFLPCFDFIKEDIQAEGIIEARKAHVGRRQRTRR